MTLPRHILPGATYLITRRTSERRFFLRPDPIVNQVIAYCAARAAEKHNIQLHCLDVLSNHEHCVLTDVNGVLPDFLHDYHHHTACCLNEHYDRQENLWDNSQTSVVRLVTVEAVIKEICYSQINSVKAALVRYRHQWPGVHFGPNDWLRAPIGIDRPMLFFNQDSELWQQCDIRFSIPHMLMVGREPIQVIRDINHYIDEQERDIRKVIIQQGRTFLGPKKVMQINPFDSPKSKAPKKNLCPRVAAADPEKLEQAIEEDKTFIQDYRNNRMLWEQDLPHSMPKGTFWLLHHSNAFCAPFDPG